MSCEKINETRDHNHNIEKERDKDDDDDGEEEEEQEEEDQLKCPFGILIGDTFEYLIEKKRVTIGRRSKFTREDACDVLVENSNFVSRQHFTLELNETCKKFCLMCMSKNGLFVNNVYVKPGISHLLSNNNQSIFRFPDTQIKLFFESYLTRVRSNTINNNNNNSITIKKDLNDNFVYVKATSPPPLPPPAVCQNENVLKENLALETTTQEVCLNRHIIDLASIESFDDVNSSSYDDKPLYSYAQLISQAILSSKEKQLTLNQIYAYIAKKFPFYRLNDKGWQNSIRHNLSLNRFFIKIARNHNEPGKGSFWKIDEKFESLVAQQAFLRKRSRFFNCNNYMRNSGSSVGGTTSSTNASTLSITPHSLNTTGSASQSQNENDNNSDYINLLHNSHEHVQENEAFNDPKVIISYLCSRNVNSICSKSSQSDGSSSSSSSGSGGGGGGGSSSSSGRDGIGSNSASNTSFANVFFANLLKKVASGKYKQEDYALSSSSSSNSPPSSSSSNDYNHKSTSSELVSSSQATHQDTSQASSSPKHDSNKNYDSNNSPSNAYANSSSSDDVNTSNIRNNDTNENKSDLSKKRKLSENSSSETDS